MDRLLVHVVSLGCDKNRIDTEHMLGILADLNAALVDDAGDADVLIVNTCGFIEDAKRESIDAILEMARYRKQGARALIVTGCLAQRYAGALKDELPEVDVFLGVAAYSRLPHAIKAALRGERYVCCERLDEDVRGRVRTTPAHLAYVRIADGCSNRCSYCAIPMIRGPLRSRPMKSVLSEIEELRASGVQETVLIAQDTTRYGEDLGERLLPRLVAEAADIMRGGWLRVMYGYPEGITDELIDAMLRCGSVCRYLDIPMQHFSDSVLRRMNRRHTRASGAALAQRLHGAGFALRTSLIVGFPGETHDDFDVLLECVEALRFERLGAFCYSAEEGTPAATMPGQVNGQIKRLRFEKLMALQAGIARSLNRAQVGGTLRVLVDGVDENGRLAGRTAAQAPQVDGVTYLRAKKDLTAGMFHDVLIKEADEYDLSGEILNESCQ